MSRSTSKLSSIADPGIESALECRIEAGSAYQLGQPITITGTLRNTGPSAVWVLTWNTFLTPKGHDCVRLTHDSSRVLYVGLAGPRATPRRDSYVRIPAGDSVSGQIDLGQLYAITEPGEYSALFYMPILGAVDEGSPEPPTHERAMQLTVVESETVSFRVGGVAPTSPKIKVAASALSDARPASSYPLQPQAPIFEGMTQEEMDKYRPAHYTAYKNILTALGSVQTSIDTRYYNIWFDTPWPWGRMSGWEARRATVIANLSAMADWMSTAQVKYEKKDPVGACGFDLLGYTPPGKKMSIYLCPNAFNDVFLQAFPFYNTPTALPYAWDRAFILTHELSHAAANTGDGWYSWFICSQLANFNPDLAVVNAQNYALFVMREAGSDLPMYRNYMVKCYDERTGKFLGWLHSSGNWVTLNGTDPVKAPPSGCVTVNFYHNGVEKYLNWSGTSRYVGDNGNGGQGNTQAAWNLWARATAVEWTEPDGEIFIRAKPSQRLAVNTDLGREVSWVSDDAPPPWVRLRFAFQEV